MSKFSLRGGARFILQKENTFVEITRLGLFNIEGYKQIIVEHARMKRAEII